jgi:murein DD-endopeptidase MepM/ murein hydrolase activator NlpD
VPTLRPNPWPHFPFLAVILVAILLLGGSQGVTPRAVPGRAVQLASTLISGMLLAAARPADPSYYRAVLFGGKAFPVARSNFLSILEFPNSWHDPRLRLINGKWLLVGVHLGIDIMAERGTPALAMESGVVENVGWTFYSGTRVGVRGSDGRYYLYAHLSEVQPGIAVGARITAGAALGRVGNTGYGSPGHRDEFPPHLHFGIEAGNEWLNPYPTLVRLYGATIRRTSKLQAALDKLAAAGRARAWQRQASRVYMSLRPLGGE